MLDKVYVHQANQILTYRRTGKDIKTGKIIRKRPDGFEEIDDYWSESGESYQKTQNFRI